MTSRSGLREEVKELSEGTLSALPADSRLKMLVDATAAGDEQIVERLPKTAPRRKYETMDREYEKRIHMAFDLSLEATYRLHTSYLFWELRLSELETLAATRPETYEAVVDDEQPISFGERSAATRLYIDYSAYERFAEEHLDISLEEFLSLSRTELSDLELGDVAAQIGENGWLAESVRKQWLTAPASTVPEEELSIDDAVDVVYESIVDDWQKAKENY
jgi:hypothetical protein